MYELISFILYFSKIKINDCMSDFQKSLLTFFSTCKVLFDNNDKPF